MVNYFAEKYFNKVSKEDLFATVCFFEHHPNINGYLLQTAITETILSRPDFTNDIIIPKEVIISVLFQLASQILKQLLKVTKVSTIYRKTYGQILTGHKLGPYDIQLMLICTVSEPDFGTFLFFCNNSGISQPNLMFNTAFFRIDL